MNFKTFEAMVIKKHGDNKYARILFLDCNDLGKVTYDLLPCWSWCMLTYLWPIIAENYIKAISDI